MPSNLKALPRAEDGLSFLFVEHAVIEQEALSVAVYTVDGKVAVPAAGLACLALGPGTRISHAAMGRLAASGTTVLWLGEEGARFYAAGFGKTRSSRNLLHQASAWADETLRLRTIYRMYELRFREPVGSAVTLQQIRGMEGARVRDAYAAASHEFGVPWSGRRYRRDDWGGADPVNRALSAASALLYGVCHGAIVAAGFSPAIGFIHTGKQLSFVYDLADLYKAETVVPAAFEAAAKAPAHPEKVVRRLMRDRITGGRLLTRALADLRRLFDLEDDSPQDGELEEVGQLWDPEGDIEGGVLHAGDGDRGRT